MVRLKNILGLLSVLLLASCSQQLLAQAKFYASAPKSIPVNQTFQLKYTLENANGGNLKLPTMADFQVVGGPNTSTSMQWVNGNVTQSVTYSYVLKPKKEGTFKIGKATITVSGVNMESNELTIEVGKPVQQQQRQRNPHDPFDDPFFDQQEEPEVPQAEMEKQLKDEVFFKLSVNRNSVYKGEMLTATYRLYFRQNLGGFNITKAPAFDGYWSQEVELDPKRRPTVEVVNGKQYHVVDILKYNLYPQRAGSVPVSGSDLVTVVQVPMRGRSVFDIFGRVQQVEMNLKANPVAVNVKDLPEQGKPSDFNGVVGKFTVESKLSSKEAKTDEPITYTIKISGTGNLKFVEAPLVKMPEAFEVYDPKVKENLTNGANGLTGTKQYDYLMIPRQPGEFKIEANNFSYFDPATGKYVTIPGPEFAVKVTGEPSKNANTNAPVATAKAEVAELGNDIRYIKTDTPVFETDNSLLATAGMAAAYGAPILLFIGLLAVKRRNQTLAADVIGVKRRRAIGLAKKRLNAAEKFLAQQNKQGFYNEVSRALWGYLGDKLNIDMASLSKDNVEEKLLARNVNPETISKLKGLLSTCDMALYAPIGGGDEMKQNYEVAMNLMADFEEEIKS